MLDEVNTIFSEKICQDYKEYIEAYAKLRYLKRNKCICGKAIPTFGLQG